MEYDIPTKGSFIRAYRMKSMPERYLDYLYIANGGLAFKVSEESHSFADEMSKIPPFYIDEATRNKLADLNDVQTLNDYSTFIHQSEDPQGVVECGSFNPLTIGAVLKCGVEMKELGGSDEIRVICTETGKNFDPPKLIELSNTTSQTRLSLQLEDGEVDDYLKIYTNYVRVDDGNGDCHYDLYFNIQNLFNSPFEYISSVTNQPNVLIIPDSYLHLSGDKWKKVYDDKGRFLCNEIDDAKVEAIKEGGILTIYGQAKTYSNDQLSDTRTIKLFQYRIYNISDDKPKFLIDKIYDITRLALLPNADNEISIEFQDVLHTIDESDFEQEEDGKFRKLNKDVVVIQPVKVKYNWNPEDDFRMNSISFQILNDIIDFENTPRLMGYSHQARTLRNKDGEPYYDHWSDRYMSLEFEGEYKTPRMTLTYDPRGGYNFETFYLKWVLPKGFNVMDTMDRLGGYVFGTSTSGTVVDCNNPIATPNIRTKVGNVMVRVHKPKKMYLGLEHSTTQRKNGYVLTGLADAMREAILSNAITEDDIKDKVKETTT